MDRQVKVGILNVGCANSTWFLDKIDDCDVCMTMCYDGKNDWWNVSLYSEKSDIDCSRLATIMGGGGHRGAGGFKKSGYIPPDIVVEL